MTVRDSTLVRPNFLVCGASKGGTTALYHYLQAHPDIFLPEKKETQFFSDWEEYQNGIEWLAETHYADWKGEKAIGEASPQTMAAPGAPYRIAEQCPEARLIFLLRDPVDRMFSHYHYEIRNGRLNPIHSFSHRIRIPSAWRSEMIWQGLYYEHLRRFEDCFDRSQMMPILTRDLKQNTGGVLRDVFGFLGVDASVDIDTTQRRNVTSYPQPEWLFKVVWGLLYTARSALGGRFSGFTEPIAAPVRRLFFRSGKTEKPRMSADDRAFLASAFSSWNERLAGYLDRDLSHWT
jgi:hypothetical protein